jgi:hypothetical protein
MSLSHLKELRAALENHGWKIVAERLREEDFDVGGAATWEVRKSDKGSSVLIDFAGFGSLGEHIPLEKSYACHVRGRSDVDLYFWRINRSRERWLRDLASFVTSLETVSAASDTRPS